IQNSPIPVRAITQDCPYNHSSSLISSPLGYFQHFGRFQVGITNGHVAGGTLCKRYKGIAGDRLIIEHSRYPSVAAFSDALHDRHLSKERQFKLVGECLSAAFPKDIVFVFG